MIKDWLDSYHPANREEAKDALREIMQEIALAGLSRTGFFEKAAFYGGTALRIFYGLDRFSEDLDFSLLSVDPEFSLEKYQDAIINEFAALGMQVSISEKQKAVKTNINSAFLKSETIWKELVLEGIIPQNGLKEVANIKIKIEVDTEPPLGFTTEEKLLLQPFSFYVKCLSLPDLFAGKMHALLFRKWGTNVKGRDWYDMEWYIRKGYQLNLEHFLLRAIDSGDWQKKTMSEVEFRELLAAKIDSVKLEFVKADISRFIKNPKVLEIWSASYFHDLTAKLKIQKAK
jgi:predicted nucleotidyltransferase component of viral defense system